MGERYHPQGRMSIKILLAIGGLWDPLGMLRRHFLGEGGGGPTKMFHGNVSQKQGAV